MNHIIYSLLLFFSLFFVTFSGDSQIYGFPIFYFSLFLFLLAINWNKNTVLLKIPVSNGCYILLLMPVFIISITIGYSYLYPLWSINTILSYFIILNVVISYYYHEKYLNIRKGLRLLSFLLLWIFFIGVFISNTDRGSFIFGPNMLYRVFSILGILILLSYKDCCYKKNIAIVVNILIIIALLKTGSRGIIPIVIIFMIFSYHFVVGKLSFKKISLLLSFITLAFFIFVSFKKDLLLSSRYSNFDFEGNRSLSLRVKPWSDLWYNFQDWLFSFGHKFSDFKATFWAPDFPYHHNIFLEISYYYGFLGFILCGFMLYGLKSIITDIFKIEFGLYISMCYISLILFIGASFSGNLSDNFIVLSYFMVLKTLKKRIYTDEKISN